MEVGTVTLRVCRLVAYLLAGCLVLLGLVTPSEAATGTTTTVPTTVGKGVGSGQWGFVGDIETNNGTTTFSYGLAFSPVDDSLWVSDSGKVISSKTLCGLLGLGTSPCQQGTPRVFKYDRVGDVAGAADERTLGEYTVDGTYASGTAYAQSPQRNSGIGAKYDVIGDRQTVTYPAAEKSVHGPRDIVFTADGTAWIVDSEAVAPVGGPAGAIKRYAPDMSDLADAGWTGSWAQKDQPGVHFYRVGNAITPNNTVLVNSEVSDRLQEYAADGTWIRSIKLDVPANTGGTGDPGYRNPYGVEVDPVDGSMYIPLINFRDDTYWKAQNPYLEKRDANGTIIGKIGEGYLPKGQVVFEAAVEPKNQHVFVWSQNSAVFEFTKDGAFVREYNSTQFPGLTNVRDLAFDTNGRMYFTVAEGTNQTRVMILGKTPDPVEGVCGTFNADKTQATLNFACSSLVTPAPYQQTALRDFVVEASTDGGATWTLMPKTAASIATTRTLTGLDPAATYQFRVSAWNEAGNSDWETISMVDYTPTPDTATTQQPDPVTIDVSANDTGTSTPTDAMLVAADGTSTNEVVVAGQGTFTMSGNNVVFTPQPGFVGTSDEITYRVTFGTCVLTSTLKVTVTAAKPKLTLVAAGEVPNQWTLTADGPVDLSGPTGTSGTVSAGDYDLSESGPSGYDSSDWTCVDANGSAVTLTGTSLTLTDGQDVTCTIIHSRKPVPPTTLTLAVTGDNPSAWTLHADGPTPLVGPNGVNGTIQPGTYTLSETGPTGYKASAWTCRTSKGTTLTVTSGRVVIPAGADVTCTIKNTRSLMTISFQVDRYYNGTSYLARRAAGYDNDGLLKWAEDRPHYGYSKWQFVTVTVPTTASKADIIKAINAKTSSAIGDVSTTAKVSSLKTGRNVTIAWKLQTSKGARPVAGGLAWGSRHNLSQQFFARS